MSDSGIPMDPRLIGTIRRYLRYGWRTSLIVSLIRFQFDAPVQPRCVENLRRGRPCSAACREHCRVRTSERWCTPQPVLCPIREHNIDPPEAD